MASALTLKNVGKYFGDFWVLRDICVSVPAKKITAFIGPNGAGKTTLLHLVAGSLAPDTGSILFGSQEIAGMPAHAVARMGIGRQFQDIRIFSGMTVLDNMLVGMSRPQERAPWRALLPKGKALPRIDSYKNEAMDWLGYVGLSDCSDRYAKELSFGQQKLLSLARLFARKSTVLLLDEPTAGLSPRMVDEVSDLIHRAVREKEITVALVEHNMSVVANLASWIHFFHEGRVAFSGESEHVLGNRSVREIYMGL